MIFRAAWVGSSALPWLQGGPLPPSPPRRSSTPAVVESRSPRSPETPQGDVMEVKIYRKQGKTWENMGKSQFWSHQMTGNQRFYHGFWSWEKSRVIMMNHSVFGAYNTWVVRKSTACPKVATFMATLFSPNLPWGIVDP